MSCTATVATGLSVLSAEKEATSNENQGNFNFTSEMCCITRQLESVVLEHQAIAMDKRFLCFSLEGLDRLVPLRKG